jgi:hypothetical protein
VFEYENTRGGRSSTELCQGAILSIGCNIFLCYLQNEFFYICSKKYTYHILQVTAAISDHWQLWDLRPQRTNSQEHVGLKKPFICLIWESTEFALLNRIPHLLPTERQNQKNKYFFYKITHFTILDLFTLEYYIQLSNLTWSLSFIYNMFIPT